jgi:hypothetical protein
MVYENYYFFYFTTCRDFMVTSFLFAKFFSDKHPASAATFDSNAYFETAAKGEKDF